MANPKMIAEEYFEAIPKREHDKIRKLMHPKYSYSGADGQRHKGADAGIEVADMYASAFSDLRLEIQHMYICDNVVVTEFFGTGTHKGELMGIAPTGKEVKVPVCNILEIRDGKIYAEREYFDTAVLLQQLGVDMQKHRVMA